MQPAKKHPTHFTPSVKNEITEIVDDRVRIVSVPREDFSELKAIVRDLAESQRRTDLKMEELAEAQKRTENRLDRLTEKVEELAEAQKRTENRLDRLTEKVEELAEAQKRTEIKVEELAEAQKRTEMRLDRLTEKVEELAEAQKRTEIKVEELAEAQKRTEIKLDTKFNELSNQITTLGGRWGIYTEETFRATVKALLERQKGVSVTRGYYGDREVDMIISNGEHILLEITSRMKKSDIGRIIASGEDYYQKTGFKPTLMIATSYISPKTYPHVLNAPDKIEIFSYEVDE